MIHRSFDSILCEAAPQKDGGIAPSRRGDVFRPTGRDGSATPIFFRGKKMRLAWWKRKQRRVPAKALAGIPAPGIRTGVGTDNALRCAGTNKQRQSGFDRVVTDCLCFLFAAAIRRTKGRVRENHVEILCFAPHGGIKMTAGTIGDGFYRPHRHNSRGRRNRLSPGLLRAAPSLLHL